MASIFGRQPHTLILKDYTIILPTGPPKEGNVMHIANIDSTHNIINFEWSEKSSTTETKFSDSRITDKLYFGSTSTDEYIQGDDTNLTIISGGVLNITATLVDITGLLTTSGKINVKDTTEATNTTDGSLQTDGGLSVAKKAVIGNLTLADGSITDSSGSISFGNENLSTTGTLASGNLTVTGTGSFSSTISAVTGSTIGNLTLADGSITDSSGTISFGNENLSTTGTLGCGVLTAASGSRIGNLILTDGNITNSSSDTTVLTVLKTSDHSEPGLIMKNTSGDASIRVEAEGGESYLEIANTSDTSGDETNSWGIGMNDDTNLHICWGTNSTANKTDIIEINHSELFGSFMSTTTFKYDIDVEGIVIFSNLPTMEPTIVGQLWNDGGTLKIVTS